MEPGIAVVALRCRRNRAASAQPLAAGEMRICRMTEFEMARLAVAQLTAWATIAYAVIVLLVGAGQI